jgi:putative transposase
LIQAERYLLACMAYIDLNPVRAGSRGRRGGLPVVQPRALHRAPGRQAFTPHPLFWELGNTPFAREAAYAELVHAGITVAQQTAVDALGAPVAGRWASRILWRICKSARRRVSPAQARPVSVAPSGAKKLNQIGTFPA